MLLGSLLEQQAFFFARTEQRLGIGRPFLFCISFIMVKFKRISDEKNFSCPQRQGFFAKRSNEGAIIPT